MTILILCIVVSIQQLIYIKCWQRGRLEEQVRQHNAKKTEDVLETGHADENTKKKEDDSYDVTLDDDFLTALEYGMPPASGMV